MRAFLTVILLALAAYAASFLLFVARLPTTPADAHADGIVALTGGDTRLDAAVALLEHGAGQRLLISGAGMVTSKDVLRHRVHGGPRFSCCADVGYAAEDTHGNAEEAADWAREHNFKSLVIVTARYHMPRALNEFSTVMPGERLVAYPVEQDRIDVGDWWHHPKTAALLNREYVKYLASLTMSVLARSSRA